MVPLVENLSNAAGFVRGYVGVQQSHVEREPLTTAVASHQMDLARSGDHRIEVAFQIIRQSLVTQALAMLHGVCSCHRQSLLYAQDVRSRRDRAKNFSARARTFLQVYPGPLRLLPV